MSTWDQARNGVKMLGNVIHGLEAIQGYTKLGGPRAAEALKAIDAIITALLQGFAGKLTADGVAAEVTRLYQGLAGNDAAIDAKIRAAAQPKP